ncbi:hypothetical protein JYU34_016274 [Plutella xylostella]|uniref:Odorant receptor n=2 Tax=Plutella xylostella TaxID=51655 RepID=A0ABQ7Q3N8_PLUXY|nr:hypothetical protein JYU34_016274 [Plutella xylostella]
MIRRFLKSLEDPQYPLLAPNLWMLKKIGMILPEDKTAKICYLILHEIVTFFVITQYIELYVIRSDMDLVLTNLKISMLSIVCIVKSNTCVVWQKNWVEVINYITTTDKEERDDINPQRSSVLKSYTKYCRKITYFYWVLVFITFITVITTPFIKHLSETYIENIDPSELSDNFEHIFSSWVPFNKNEYPGSWITIAWHVFVCAYGAGTMAAFDVSAMVMMVFFGGKIDLLRLRCQGIFGNMEKGLSDEETSEMFLRLHRAHVLLLRYSRMFNSMLSPVMFLYVVMCSLMLCASAFQLTSARSATQKLLMAEYLVFGTVQLFMYCWHSNDVLYKSERVTLGPYESDWWKTSAKQQRSLLLLTGQLNKTIFFTAGPFTYLTLPTFITILKGAYSYYTLLRK